MNDRFKSLSNFTDGGIPPLPYEVNVFPELQEYEKTIGPESLHSWPKPPYHFRSLKCGCYLINMTSSHNNLSVFDGTLRVECDGNKRRASGDLYQRKLLYFPQARWLNYTYRGFPFLPPKPNPALGIPIFPRNSYRYYIRVKKLLQYITAADSFLLEFEMWRFHKNTKSWTNEGTYSADMEWTTAPTGFPSSNDYLEGEIKNSDEIVVGRLSMGWVSDYLRKATVEIDRVSASEAPLNNGDGVDWGSIFDEVGWDVNVVNSDSNLTEPSGESWSNAELHQGMIDWRDNTNLDRNWVYHLICVRQLDFTSRGVMYDSIADTNNIPREGAAISSHWKFEDWESWGSCRDMRFGSATGPYFRTAVHEIGHAMMMFHPGGTGNHLLQVTPQIRDNAVDPVEFPDNIDWSFSNEDQTRFRHLPDVVVRPGTVLRFWTDVNSSYGGVPASPLDEIPEVEGMELNVLPELTEVPIGAPVRINFQLINTGEHPIPAPGRLNMKSGHISGKVIDPSGTQRTFATIVRVLDDMDIQLLNPTERRYDSLTLLRGYEGALFPFPGQHKVSVEVTWVINGNIFQFSGETNVMITQAVDKNHAKVASKIIASPDTLVTLVIGGDHLKDGIESIKDAIKNPVLRPHYAFIEARRLSERFYKRKANLRAFAELITDDVVMSTAEIKKAAKIIKSKKADPNLRKIVSKILKKKVKKLVASDDIKDMVNLL